MAQKTWPDLSGYRPLGRNETIVLERQGCSCRDWSKVRVKDGFDPRRVWNTKFSGEVCLGVFNDEVPMPAGLARSSGVYDSRIHNATIGDNALLSRVGQLSNYDLEPGVVVDNVGILAVRGVSAFANGVRINVLNEAGGRELPLFERLTSQISYLLVTRRHDKSLVDGLEAMIGKIVEQRTSNRGEILKGSRILNTGQVINVRIGPYAAIEGALVLEEGTVWGCERDPSFIGEGVIGRRFIVQSGSRIESSASLADCFVGQGVRLGKQFAAENSAFFANCEGFQGEAVSLFAGPYTVSHHKSTLLIAGLSSFFNAGSATNQSNHMYRLGPVHQGVFERGSKTGSFSYLLWPSRVGAYTTVVGRHYTNFDSFAFPFSTVKEAAGMSVLTPAVNLVAVGTVRDAAKWPARDRRRDPDPLDLVHFDLLSPYVVSRMEKAIGLLADLEKSPDDGTEYVAFGGLRLKRSILKTSIRYYEMGLKIGLGRALLDRLGNALDAGSLEGLRLKLAPAEAPANAEWHDLSGLFVTAGSLRKLVADIASGEIGDLDAVRAELKAIDAAYPELRWSWYAGLLERRYGVSAAAVTPDVLRRIVTGWNEAVVEFNDLVSRDASREFGPAAMIGYGIDGDDSVRKADFESVRGTFESDRFVRGLADESAAAGRKAEELKAAIASLA